MTQVILDLPESAFATLHQAPKEFAQEMRVAAIKWYELGRLSQGRAAEIAGLTRAGFIDALSRYKVSPFQYTAEEVIEELQSSVGSPILRTTTGDRPIIRPQDPPAGAVETISRVINSLE